VQLAHLEKAAAVFTQAPVVAHNLEVAMGKEDKPGNQLIQLILFVYQ
jgi:hypothetical protein